MLFYKQPDPLEKFVYNSSVRKRSTLMSEVILLLDKLYPEVWIVADLYSHMDPPLLSPHILRKNSARSENLIVDTMQQPVSNSSYYTYLLNHCHIRKTSSSRLKTEIKGKLQFMKSWLTERHINEKDMDIIENTLDSDYFGIFCGRKVYIGFTAYARNPITHCKEQISETLFSNAIYDNWEFTAVAPSFAPATGGTEHIIKLKDNNQIMPPATVQIKLSDEGNSWQAYAIGHLESDGIHFTAPPYTGYMNSIDANRLINLEVMLGLGSNAGAFKFVYVE